MEHKSLLMAVILYSVAFLYAAGRLKLGLPYRTWPKLLGLLPGFLLHTHFLWERGLSAGRCPVSGIFETLTFIAWCLVALHLVILIFSRINYLTVFYLPAVILIQVAALFLAPDTVVMENHKAFPFHASIIMLGYAVFGLAGSVALMYLVQESQLRRHRIGSSFMLLPPILRLESIHGFLLLAGFGLLSAGLLSGIVGLRGEDTGFSWTDVKFLWSLLIWGLYLVLLFGKFFWHLNARALSWFSMGGFLFILGTYWIANAYSTFHRY